MMSFIPPIDKKEVDFDTLSSIPISPWHISSQLCEAIYLYSLKNKDPECYFKDDNSLLSRIRADVFFKVFDSILHALSQRWQHKIDLSGSTQLCGMHKKINTYCEIQFNG